MIRVENEPRDYAWGSVGEISRFMGVVPSGKPEAELWLGTHPGSPTALVGAPAGQAQTIAELRQMQGKKPLPYLLKLLAAAEPLSIQAHPSKAQAQEGFARENAAGIPLDTPQRNYRDDNHKPELIVCLGDEFEALCGFRSVEQTLADLEALKAAKEKAHEPTPALERFAQELSARGDEVYAWALPWALTSVQAHELVAELSSASALKQNPLLARLAEKYPGDPGILVALMLNHVWLNRGEALYLPAGNMHAYLHGFGIEIMAASDNVLRGGLTTKHIDVEELLAVVQPHVLPVPYLKAQEIGHGVEVFHPDVPDFQLARLTLKNGTGSELTLERSAIAVCTQGKISLTGHESQITLDHGQMAYIPSEEGSVTFSGEGEIFIAL